MTDLAQDFERRAKEQTEAAQTLIEAADFNTDPKKQTLFVVGKVTGKFLHALAELTAYLKATDQLDEAAARRQEIVERSNAIRTAAALGNWDEVNRLAAGFGGGEGSDGG
jgi:hypothetical protein